MFLLPLYPIIASMQNERIYIDTKYRFVTLYGYDDILRLEGITDVFQTFI